MNIRLASCLALFLACQAAPVLAAGCTVPLKIVNIGTDDKPEYKLGINVGLGGGAPRLYEFDTGGPGFWAAYDETSDPQWWGAARVLSRGDMQTVYTSGNAYVANLVRTRVSLYDPASTSPKSPLCGTGSQQVQVSQITSYTNALKPGLQKKWDDAMKNGTAPLSGAFWGDFGAALRPGLNTAGTAGVYSVLPQIASQTMSYHRGFIIHVGRPDGSSRPAVKIGLSYNDVMSFTSLVRMNPKCPPQKRKQPNYCLPGWHKWSTVPVTAFSEQQFEARVAVGHGGNRQVFDEIGVTLDTGAPNATLWQLGNVVLDTSFLKDPTLIPGTNPPSYSGDLKDGATVTVQSLAANTVRPRWLPFEAMLTQQAPQKISASAHTDGGGDPAYINTGFWFYTQWDVMFDLDAGTVGFRPAQ